MSSISIECDNSSVETMEKKSREAKESVSSPTRLISDVSHDEMDPVSDYSSDSKSINVANYVSPLLEGRKITSAFEGNKDNLVLSSAHTKPSESSCSDFDCSESRLRFRPREDSLIEESAITEEPLDPDAQQKAWDFATEFRIFLKAALDLLAERDRQAPEFGMMDPIVLKSGSLKKASHLMNGLWNAKFVEVRRGMFSYYENAVSKDASGEEELLRKDIPLVASSCSCRAVKLHQKALNLAPSGAIFELAVNGTKRLWMARTRADRQLWMQTIQNAMVGGSLTRGDSLMDHHGVMRGISQRSPFNSDLRKYMKAQSALRNAKSKSDYMDGLRMLVNHSLKVPVKWIAKQSSALDGTDAAFREENVNLSVDQLWRDLQRDSVTINGKTFRGDTAFGPDRIIGALMQEILSVGIANGERGVRRDIPEYQALAYARDILLSGNRTRSGGDSYYCASTLCSNSDLVVLVPGTGEVEPVVIDVTEDESDSFCSSVVEKTGWMLTKNKSQKEWSKFFFVLSEGTLSFYEAAVPRPHRLRGQIVLHDATLSISKFPSEEDVDSPPNYMLTLQKESSGRERYLLFDSDEMLLDWTYALECTLKMSGGSATRRFGHRRRSFSSSDITIPLSKLEVISLAAQSVKIRAVSLGIDPQLVERRLAEYANMTVSAILVSIHACTDYKVCTRDPTGDEQEDTWATLRAHFLQSFRVYGGPNGRIIRGEEIVRVSVDWFDSAGIEQQPSSEMNDDSSASPWRARSRRIFRSFSTTEDDKPDETVELPALE